MLIMCQDACTYVCVCAGLLNSSAYVAVVCVRERARGRMPADAVFEIENVRADGDVYFEYAMFRKVNFLPRVDWGLRYL